MNNILKCYVCGNIKIDAMSITPCLHSFCNKCIIISTINIGDNDSATHDETISYVSNCPKCLKPVKDVNFNPEIYGTIELEQNGKLACVWDCGFKYDKIAQHSRDANGKIFYLIHWKTREITWEPEENMNEQDDTFIDYKNANGL